MRKITITVAAAAALLLAACGGGGGGGGDSAGDHRPTASHLAFPLGAGDIRHAGVDQGADHLGQLPVVGQRGATRVRYGTLDDGVGRDTVVAYLTEAGAMTARWYDVPPDIRVIGSATARERQLVTETVEAINLSLPPEHRIKLAPPLAGLSLRHTVNSAGRYFRGRDHRPNTIHIEFLDCAAYYDCGSSGSTAWGNGARLHAYIQMSRGTPAYGRDDWARILIAHEVLHALLADDHVGRRFDSIMHAGSSIYRSGLASILKPIDREALQALYGHLELRSVPTDLGPWLSTSVHLAGNGRHANFGVALRNGYAEPWAHGPAPHATLGQNRALSGTVTWDGTLLGFSDRSPVAGDASIAVQLATLRGTADFTSLETWSAGTAPGAAGTGTTWLDGDLGYAIAVDGNTFRRTGGDAGRLTGIFTGAAHEGAAGTLERSDLTAAFGATR